ncbi:hypothetical protein PoB_007047600 [Plakobranchus ocellatus]|uniref:Uncharacterized protein n=1 Tax=Plakobranchus ocellatus TaxID=259542 RepID=A0AAV4DIJ8_9GAST|nr:hypothetical protein PoB_007047600 [Plakobranchus ocellatus]
MSGRYTVQHDQRLVRTPLTGGHFPSLSFANMEKKKLKKAVRAETTCRKSGSGMRRLQSQEHGALVTGTLRYRNIMAARPGRDLVSKQQLHDT